MEFNKKFKTIVSNIHADFKPPDKSILVYYMEALSGELKFMLRDKDFETLKAAQDLAVKIDENMQSSGKSNLLAFTRGMHVVPKHQDKGKAVETEARDSSKDAMKEMVDTIKTLVANHTAQMTAMQNRFVTMEKTHVAQLSQLQRFPPKGNQDRWQKKAPPYEKRPPNQLDSTNMVEEVTPFCRPCKYFHEESTCYSAYQVMKHGLPETSSHEAPSREPEYINTIGHTYPLSDQHWQQAVAYSQEKDFTSQNYGEKPTPD